MAETPNVMPSLHMPLQSGSDRVLRDMRRSYRQSKYLGIIERVRAAMPDAAITTDIIVGFPGETEEDFQATLDVVAGRAVLRRLHLPVLQAPRHPRRRPRRTRSPKAVVQERYERLVEVVDEVAWAENQRARGPHRRADGRRGRGPQGRRDPPALRPRARQPAGALHARRLADGSPVDVRPGDMVEVVITYGAPHHLVADGPVQSVRRTRAGDAWEARTAPPPGVPLGLPTSASRPRSRPRTAAHAERGDSQSGSRVALGHDRGPTATPSLEQLSFVAGGTGVPLA